MKNSIIQHLKNKSFFLIGIGGAGMMGIAELLHNMGFLVSGSDISLTNDIERLRSLKIKISIGHNSKNINHADIVVYSNAIKANNVELKYARKIGITVLSRMEILAELMRLKYGISITGSHGKTTTTSLLCHIMYKNHLDPTYLIGGKLKTDDPHVKLGNSDFLVTETDESDPGFSILKPHLVVLTNLDKEHLDNYDNKYQNLENSMLYFINSIPFYGKIFINGDDKNSKKLLKSINRSIFSYGFDKSNNLRAEFIGYSKRQMIFKIIHKNMAYKVSTNLLGKHNIYNILAAVSVCLNLSISISKALASIKSFYGASRRFDVYKKISINKSKPIIIDDYGHHPTEIASTIKTIKDIYDNRKIIMVFQPHRFTRTKAYWRLFVNIIKQVDQIIILPTYSAGEKNNSFDSSFLFKKLKNKEKTYLKSISGTIEELRKQDYDNSVLLLQGAGDIKSIINILKQNDN